MRFDNTENLKKEERADSDANPLTSFGRDDDFTDELIKGICGKDKKKEETPKTATIESKNPKSDTGQNEHKALGKRQRTRKKRRVIS